MRYSVSTDAEKPNRLIFEKVNLAEIISFNLVNDMQNNLVIGMNIAQLKKQQILKFLLIGCGTITLLAVAIVIGVGIWLFTGREDINMTSYHPFRSAPAKAQYLKLYDMRAKKWPVESETRFVHTAYGQTFIRMSGPAGAPPLVLLHEAVAIRCNGYQTSKRYPGVIESMRWIIFMTLVEVYTPESSRARMNL